MPKLRIGLTQRVEVVESYGERRDCLDQEWTRLLEGIGFIPVPLPNSTEDPAGLISESSLDGFILTGGNDLSHLENASNAAPERDRFEKQILSFCAQENVPVLGVCRGLQVMVTQYGGTLDRIEGHIATRHSIHSASEDEDWIPDRDEVNSFHGWGIRPQGLGNDFITLATCQDGTVEAVRHKSLPQWGIMWHPERSPNDERDRVLIQRIFRGNQR